MRLFTILNKYKKVRYNFNNSDEYKYYVKNRNLLNKFESFSYLYDCDDNEFLIMRANIILHGLKNKKSLEDDAKEIAKTIDPSQKENLRKFKIFMREMSVSLPYYMDGKNKIFIPFFSKALNNIYSNEQDKILVYPYKNLDQFFENSIVDAFDTYGAELFNSYFTKLVKIASNGKEIAYFHYDLNTIYIVNSQGRLDIKIALFDKFIKRPNKNHMLERIKPVVESYFANDRQGFIDNLYKNNFISSKLLEIIKKNDEAK